MKVLAWSLPLLLVAGCVARAPKPDAALPDEVQTESKTASLIEMLPDGHKPGSTVEVNGASIIAIVAERAPKDTPYLVLDEAIKAGVCTVRETGAVDEDGNQVDGDVNTLLVTNTGDKPVFLMAGDLVLGGKQDRVLAESVVVDANSKDVRIPVFCVESGRWVTQGKDGETGARGYFFNDASCGQVDMNVKRVALTNANQGEVWKEVAEVTGGLNVAAPSGTFRATYDDEKTRERVDAAYKQCAGLVKDQVVGFAVVQDGEVAVLDLFESSGLTAKVSEKLLRSYIMTAIGDGYALPVEAKTVRALRAASWEIEYDGVRLADVVSHLNATRVVAIRMDGISPDTVISVDAGRVSGDVALRLLADSAECAVIVQGEAVVLTTREQLSQVQQGAPAQEAPTYYGEPTPPSEGGPVLQQAVRPRVAGSFLTSSPATPTTATPNARTLNQREYTPDNMKYACEDKATGRKVQTSYMRR